jgi:hypothetical protein
MKIQRNGFENITKNFNFQIGLNFLPDVLVFKNLECLKLKIKE